MKLPTMDDIGWGLMMMAVGMGVVFLLLLALMVVLRLIGRLDGPSPRAAAKASAAAPVPATTTDAEADGTAPEAPAAPVVRIVADGLDEDQVAAITAAVIMHAEIRRRSAGPETRAHAPGSQLFASRWLAVGRGHQTNPFTRR